MKGFVFASLRFPREMRSLKELNVRVKLNAFFLSACKSLHNYAF